MVVVSLGGGPNAPSVPPQPHVRLWPGLLAGLIALLVGAGGVWATWRVFVVSRPGQLVDHAAFQGAGMHQTGLWQIAERVLSVVSVPFLVLVLVTTMLIAVLRRRWGLAVQVAVLLAGANLTTQVLKNVVLGRPDHGIGHMHANTLPSGHTTVAASVAAALLFVVPPRVRAWAGLGGVLYTGATGVSTLIGRWHRPSDVVAAVLVVLAWTGLVALLATPGGRRAAEREATGMRAVRPRRPSTAPFWVAGLLTVGAAGLGAVAALALERTWHHPDPLSAPATLTAYGGGALGVAAATCAAFALMLLATQLATSAPRSGRRTLRPQWAV